MFRVLRKEGKHSTVLTITNQVPDDWKYVEVEPIEFLIPKEWGIDTTDMVILKIKKVG